MELLEGQTLDKLISLGSLPVPRTIDIGIQLADALDAAHKKGIIHRNGLQSLWLRHIPTGSNTQVVTPAATRYGGLTFSPDGNYIYFVRREDSEQAIASLYDAPMLGGTPRLLIKDVDSPIAFSPDGQH